MYSIAICEDDAPVRDDIARRVGAILIELNVSHDIAAFASAEALEAAVQANAAPFDLVLLDIQLPGRTGVALGVDLREGDERLGIIFITNSPDYAVEGYRAQPCNYLLKPVSDAALGQALRRELKRRGLDQMVVFREKGLCVRIPAAEILYLESFDHALRVHTIKQRFSFNLSLGQAAALLPTGMFARCHNSFMVGLSHIRSASSTKIVLQNGEALPVGRRYRDEFHRVFIGHFFPG